LFPRRIHAFAAPGLVARNCGGVSRRKGPVRELVTELSQRFCLFSPLDFAGSIHSPQQNSGPGTAGNRACVGLEHNSSIRCGAAYSGNTSALRPAIGCAILLDHGDRVGQQRVRMEPGF
jgi:hypothetical protein